VPMGDRCQDPLGDELAEGRLALGVTGRAEAALLAREGEQVLMAAGRTANFLPSGNFQIRFIALVDLFSPFNSGYYF